MSTDTTNTGTTTSGHALGLPPDWPGHRHGGDIPAISAGHSAGGPQDFQQPRSGPPGQPPSVPTPRQQPGTEQPRAAPPGLGLEHQRHQHQVLLHQQQQQQHPFASPYGPGPYGLPLEQFGFVPTTHAQLDRPQQWPVADQSVQFHVIPPVTQAPTVGVYQHQPFPQDDAPNPQTKREAPSSSSPLTKVPASPYPNPPTHQQQRPSVGRSSDSPMQSQTAVISPQQQNSAPISGTPATGTSRGASQQPARSPRTSKKRSREEAEDGEEALEEEAAKKPKPPRGRPRLTGVGETPNERRRKQIREAQRAYRNRKDQAITDLEEKVKKLEEAKTVMTQEFSGFLQLLQAQGAAHANPELSQRFRDIHQKYFSSPTGQAPRESDEHSGASSTAGREKAAAQHHQRRPTMGTVSTTSSDHHTAMPSAAPARPSMRGTANSFASSATSFYPPETLSYEVIAQPTPENASFPSYTPDPQAPGGWVEQPPMGQSMIPAGLQTPGPFAQPEQTFGRRLHLTTLRRALILAAMPTPPPERFGAVFGFCLLYESREAIIARLVEQIQAVSQAPMHNWEALFPHIHGYDKRITEFPGFDGEEFLDSEEVDSYLLRRGVHIPGSAEFVEVELNPNDFGSSVETGTIPANGAPCVQGAAQMRPSGMGHMPVSGTWQSHPTQVAGATATADAMTTMFTDGSASGAADTGAMNPFLCPAVPVNSWTSQNPPKFKATLNISVLIEELVSKSVCLGKTPGLRPKDVGRAVKIASGLFHAQ